MGEFPVLAGHIGGEIQTEHVEWDDVLGRAFSGSMTSIHVILGPEGIG